MSRISSVNQETIVFARQLTLSGATYITDTSAIGNTYANAASTGNYVQLTFTGTGVRIYGLTSTNQGIADIYIDSVLVTSVDTYSASLTYNVHLYENTTLSDASHTIKIQNSGTKHASSTGTTIRTVAMEYWGAARASASRSANAEARSANAEARNAPTVISSNNWFATACPAPNGRIYAAGRTPLIFTIGGNDAANTLWRSTTNGDNFRIIYSAGWASTTAIKTVYVADSGTIFISLWDGTVWRSTDEGVTFTSVLTMGGTNHYALSWSWGEYSGTILVGEYGGNTYPRKVYASTDDGITWSTVFNSQTEVGATNAHIHLAMIDPFSGDWYVTTGDGAANNNFRSTNKGSTWTSISTVIGYLGVAFYNNYVIFLRENRVVYKYVKSTGTITEVGTIGSVGNGYRMIKNNDGNLIATVYTTAAGTINAAFGIWKSTDEGATWSQIRSGKEGFDLLAPKLDADGYAWATHSTAHTSFFQTVRAK